MLDFLLAKSYKLINNFRSNRSRVKMRLVAKILNKGQENYQPITALFKKCVRSSQ